ncbi:MAG: DUF4857 domain-containing protein [Bacteroidales bacterium]
MVKISRYVLVLIGIIVTAIAIPEIYWTIFREVPSAPNVVYSRILDDFMMVQREDGVLIRKDASGNVYTRDEFEERLPMLFFRQLYASGDMPDTIKGVEMDHATLSQYSSNFTFRPAELNTPQPPLWPLLEAESGRVTLYLPEDFFRLDEQIEFIVAETNEVDRKKSKKFNDALIKEGFRFPARLIGGLPTAKKNKEEGYFIKDDAGDLFHLMQKKDKPYVARIDIPDEINIIHIKCVDKVTGEYYAFLFTDNDEVFLLMQDGYHLQKLPVDNYDRHIHRLRVREDLLNKTIAVIGDDHLDVVVVNYDYEVVNRYEDHWDPPHTRSDHKRFSWLFPFQLSLQIPESNYVTMDLFWGSHYMWLLTHVALTGLAIWLLRRKKRPLKDNAIDLLLILVTGIYGFVSTRIFPNKFYK